MADTFYDGMPNVNERLNQLYAAFAVGPYSALPLSGGTLTGPLSSTSTVYVVKTVAMGSRAPVGVVNSGTSAGWWAVGRVSLGVASTEATIRISGATSYSPSAGGSAASTVIMLRVDSDYIARGNYYTVGGPSSNTIAGVRVGADGVVYVLAGSFFTLAVYSDSSMWVEQPLTFSGAAIPAATYEIPAAYGMQLGAKTVLSLAASSMTLDGEFIGRGLFPAADNAHDVGQAATAYRTVYARTGTINTSDARLKCDFRDLTPVEIAAARDIARAIGTYRWRDAVDSKGAAAREHIGPTVQRAIEIMQAHGLDPFSYGFICHDEWEQEAIEHPAIEARYAVPATEAASEVLDSLGNVVTPATPANPGFPAVEARAAYTEVTQQAGDRYAFRYDELAMFIAAGQEARLAALEAA